jgi:hypothetical protein
VFTAPNGTVFHHGANYADDVHIAPAEGEPSVEVPIDRKAKRSRG